MLLYDSWLEVVSRLYYNSPNILLLLSYINYFLSTVDNHVDNLIKMKINEVYVE